MKNETNSKNKEITVSYLKSWLSGVLDFQDDDWVPNKEQWEKILGKIFMLTEEPQKELPVAPPTKQNSPTTAPVKSVPSGKSINIDDGERVDLPSAPPKPPRQVRVKQQSAPSKNESDGTINTGQVVETGNIDTSKSGYRSSFE